jgi:ATP-dependent DNA helicase RecG
MDLKELFDRLEELEWEDFDKTFKISGVEDAEKIEQDFTTVLRGDKFNQKIKVRSIKYNFDGKIVLAFYVPASEQKPVYFNSRKNTFIRTTYR